MVVALAGYAIAALVLLFPASRLGGNLATTIAAALGLAVVAWFLVLVLLVTPARMWYGAQREMESMVQQQSNAAPTGMTGIAVSGQASVHMQNVHISVGGTPLPDVAQPQTRESSWLAEVYLSHRSFRIYDIPRDDDGIIRNRTFEDCDIYGPAVLVPLSGRLDGCSFEGDADTVLWELSPRQERIVGAIGLEDCIFRRCRFRRIGLAGTGEFIEKAREDFANA